MDYINKLQEILNNTGLYETTTNNSNSLVIYNRLSEGSDDTTVIISYDKSHNVYVMRYHNEELYFNADSIEEIKDLIKIINISFTSMDDYIL